LVFSWSNGSFSVCDILGFPSDKSDSTFFILKNETDKKYVTGQNIENHVTQFKQFPSYLLRDHKALVRNKYTGLSCSSRFGDFCLAEKRRIDSNRCKKCINGCEKTEENKKTEINHNNVNKYYKDAIKSLSSSNKILLSEYEYKRRYFICKKCGDGVHCPNDHRLFWRFIIEKEEKCEKWGNR
jgi:hypothetical protein